MIIIAGDALRGDGDALPGERSRAGLETPVRRGGTETEILIRPSPAGGVTGKKVSTTFETFETFDDRRARWPARDRIVILF
ncbi:hypothetical protein [Streptosporangium sp. NPDC023615]|uniref:hypothetical protein n=1 Tax=Streptosporangium sp. NPDC023615 TaxID=3154794 RepID=UPI0034308917